MDYSKKILDFNNVIGLDEVKNNLKEYVVMQIKYPQLKEKDLYKDGLYYASHLELEKSYLAKVVEYEIPKKQNNLVLITLDKFLNKSLEERINLLNELFQLARNNIPSVVFIDDMDSILKYKKEEKEDIKNLQRNFLEILEIHLLTKIIPGLQFLVQRISYGI